MEKQLRRFLSLGAAPRQPHAPLDLAQVVENVLPLVAPHARHVGVDLQWEPPTRPITLNGDANALEQLLINLLLNAIEAASVAPAAVEGPRVSVRIAAHGDRVVLEVADSGPGPAAEVQERLFEPFITEKRDGVGLGLPVALEIARQHGGDIRWQRAGGLTRFIVEAPGTRLESARGQVVGC